MLRITLGDEVILLRPCPASKQAAYSILRGSLVGGLGDIAASDVSWGTLQKLINLHPRIDTDGWGFDLPDEYWVIASVLDQLDKLNTVSPLPQSIVPEAIKPIPMKSSGDNYLDLVADLSEAFGSEGAAHLLDNYGLDAINKVVLRSNERGKPHDQRKQEYLTEQHELWIKENPELFDLAISNPALLQQQLNA